MGGEEASVCLAESESEEVIFCEERKKATFPKDRVSTKYCIHGNDDGRENCPHLLPFIIPHLLNLPSFF